MPKPVTPQGGEPEAGSAPASAPVAPAAVTHEERNEFVTHLIGRHGSAIAALTQIAGEQLRFKRRAQAAEQNVANLQKQIPTAGSVVLTGEEAKAYEKIKGLGFTLDKVPEKLKSFGELESKFQATARANDLKAAAGTKYDEKVLTTLLGDTPVEFQTVNVMKADKSGIEQIQVPFVILKKDGKETREQLDSFLDREHAGFKDVLKAKTATGGATGGQNGTTRTGVVVPKQNGATSGAAAVGEEAAAANILTGIESQFMTPGMRRKEPAAS